MNHLPIGFGCLLVFFNLFICHNSYAMASESCGHQTIFGHEMLADCCDNHLSNFLSRILKKMCGELTADTCLNTSEVEKDENNGNVSPSDSKQKNNGCCLRKIFFLKRHERGSSSEVIELVPSS